MKDRDLSQQEITAVRQELDHGCEALDGATLSRLKRIRHQTLEKSATRRSMPISLPVGLVTAGMLVLALFLNYPAAPPSGLMPGPGLATEDMDLLASPDSLDFYEDIEFYLWLEENALSV